MRCFLVIEHTSEYWTCKMWAPNNQAAVILDDKELLIKAFLQWIGVPSTMIDDMIQVTKT
jgi:hypothetical protein